MFKSLSAIAAVLSILPAILSAQEGRSMFVLETMGQKLALDPPPWSTFDDYQRTSDVYVNDKTVGEYPYYQVAFLPRGTNPDDATEMYLLNVLGPPFSTPSEYLTGVEAELENGCADHAIIDPAQSVDWGDLYVVFCVNEGEGEVRTAIYDVHDQAAVETVFYLFTEPFDVLAATRGQYAPPLDQVMAKMAQYWLEHQPTRPIE